MKRCSTRAVSVDIVHKPKGELMKPERREDVEYHFFSRSSRTRETNP